MKKTGFSLVEIMVAMVIVGILAAIIVPNYSEGIRKAKVSEFIEMFSRIRIKEQQYFGESKEFLSIPKSSWKEDLQKNFEMFVDAQYFDYEVVVGADGDTYEIIATLKKDLGKAKAGAKAVINQDGQKEFRDDPDGGLEGYTSGWKDLVEK